MRALDDATLLAYLTQALDPGAAEQIAALLRADPSLQARVALLTPQLQPDPAPRDRWRIPPPGMRSGRQPLSVLVRPAAVMGPSDTLQPGDRVELRIDESAPLDAIVVVLSASDEGWEVVFPRQADELTRVGDLPVDHGRCLELIAQTEGPQRWALVLAPADWAIDWQTAERWEALRQAIFSGQVPATALQLG